MDYAADRPEVGHGGRLPAVMASEIDELLENNAEYAQSFGQAGLPTEPRRRLAVLSCMDSRIDLFAVLGLRNGEAHIVRNAGGVVTDDVVRSLMVSQRLLGTTSVLIIQHTRCGLLGLDERQFRAQLLDETGVTPHFALEAIDDLDQSVRQSIARLRASPFIAGPTAIRGAIYDVDSGRLREVPVP